MRQLPHITVHGSYTLARRKIATHILNNIKKYILLLLKVLYGSVCIIVFVKYTSFVCIIIIITIRIRTTTTTATTTTTKIAIMISIKLKI